MLIPTEKALELLLYPKSASMRLTELIQQTGEAAWTQVDAACTVTADGTIYKIGPAASAKMAMAAGAAAGVQAWGQVADNNHNMVTNGWNYLKFWIRSSAPLAAGAFQIGLSDAAGGTGGAFVDIPALAADTWTRCTLALSAAQKALTSVSSVQLKMVTDTTCDIYIDDVRFCKYDGSGTKAITPLESYTLNNTNADGVNSEMWMLPFLAGHVSVYYLPQHLVIQYRNGTPGVYAATDQVNGKSYLNATQTVVDLQRACTALVLYPGADLGSLEAFEIEVA